MWVLKLNSEVRKFQAVELNITHANVRRYILTEKNRRERLSALLSDYRLRNYT